LLFLVSRNSKALQESLKSKSEDQKRFNRLNSKFHIYFRLTIISGIAFAFTQLASVLMFNHELININSLLFIDFRYFIFIAGHIIFSVVTLAILVFSLLYFRFKPDYRHHFLQKLLRILSGIVFLFTVISLIFYQDLINGLAIPVLFGFNFLSANNFLLNIEWMVYAPLVLIFFVYTFAYRRFSRKRTHVNSRIYLLFYLLVIFAILFFSVNSGIRYFDLFASTTEKQSLFHYSAIYAGVFWLYLFSLSICSIIFSIFIFLKKDKFIGGQFAISYTLKLAHLNFYSTQLLLLLTIMPWVLLEFYKHF
jgi:hypothetical protein